MGGSRCGGGGGRHRHGKSNGKKLLVQPKKMQKKHTCEVESDRK